MKCKVFVYFLAGLAAVLGAAHAQLDPIESMPSVVGNTVVGDTIVVVGEGEVSAEPDQAIISVTISANHLDVKRAKAEADQKYQRITATVKELGVPARSIKLSALQLFPEYDWRDNRQEFKGVRVSRTLTITVDNLDLVAALLQGIVDNGVSTINSVQSVVKDTSALRRAALSSAIRDAKEKAEFLAAQFGKDLGSAYTITESLDAPAFNPITNSMRSLAQSNSVPEEHFGSLVIKSRISVVFHAR